jgi:hypothetical protein
MCSCCDRRAAEHPQLILLLLLLLLLLSAGAGAVTLIKLWVPVHHLL